MTRRSLDSLREERARLAACYASARRRHRGQGEAAARLVDRTCALLRAELATHRPRRGRPPAPRPALPDLFGEARP
jgi:hypothetical protein